MLTDISSFALLPRGALSNCVARKMTPASPSRRRFLARLPLLLLPALHPHQAAASETSWRLGQEEEPLVASEDTSFYPARRNLLLTCPAGWYLVEGAISRKRELSESESPLGTRPPPPSPPPLPLSSPPLVPDSLDPCVVGEAEIGSRCFVEVRSDLPCLTNDTVGLTCFTINRKFHFAFIAGEAPPPDTPPGSPRARQQCPRPHRCARPHTVSVSMGVHE